MMNNIMLAAIIVVLAGCAPYAEVGAGYNFDSGRYGWREQCEIGYLAVGLERGDWAVEAQHTSCLWQKPEIVTNQILVKRKFGGE